MKCSEFRKHLIEYADGRLEDSLSKKLEAHLESCQHCSIELEGLKESLTFMMAKVDDAIPEPSAEFIPKFHQQIEQMNAESRNILNFPKLSFSTTWLRVVFAVTILVFVLGTITLLQFPTSHKHELTKEEMQVITQMPGGKNLIEMLPASRPYVDALLTVQKEKTRNSGITSTLDNINIQLLEKVFQILEMSAEVLESSEIKKEEELSCYEEII